MLPPLWSCDPSGSRLHSAPPFLRPKTGGGHSFIGHREEEATNGPCLAPGRPEEPRMTWQPRAHPRANPAMGRRLGLQTAWRAGAQAPLEADPGRRARARGQCPVRGPWRDPTQACIRGSGLDSGGAAGGPARGLRSCCPGGDRSSGAGRPPCSCAAPRCSEERRAACDAESCRHLSHQTQHCALSPPPTLIVPKSLLFLPHPVGGRVSGREQGVVSTWQGG